MLSIKTNNDWLPIISQQNYFIEQNEEGVQMLSFDLSKNDESLASIHTETLVRNENNEWIVKGINLPSNIATITCDLNMKDWKTGHYLKTKDIPQIQTKTLNDILNFIKPSGWSILGGSWSTIKRTPDKEKCTRYDILQACMGLFNVQYDVDCLNNKITIVDPHKLIDNGVYVTPQLNMTGMSYRESSSERITRLYCYGADDLTFDSINRGKPYVENLTYSNDIIEGSWTDGRYTNKESLLVDGQKKIDDLAVPVGSYTINMVDLSNQEAYKFLKLSLREVAHCVINETTSINHRVVKIKTYPDTPSKKVITLSNEPRKIQDMMSQMQENITDTANSTHKNETTIRNNSKSIELVAKGLGEVQLKLTDEQIMMIISSAINGGNALETMQAIIDKSGLTIKNGGIKIYDGRGNLVFYIDQDTKKLVMNGEINADTGTIGGFSINNNGLYASYTETVPNYVENDYLKVMRYILHEITLSDSEIEYLDVNRDGYLSAGDYSLIKDVVNGRISHTWKHEFRISAMNPDKFIEYIVDRGNGIRIANYVALSSITKFATKQISDRIYAMEMKMLDHGWI